MDGERKGFGKWVENQLVRVCTGMYIAHDVFFEGGEQNDTVQTQNHAI